MRALPTRRIRRYSCVRVAVTRCVERQRELHQRLHFVVPAAADRRDLARPDRACVHAARTQSTAIRL